MHYTTAVIMKNDQIMIYNTADIETQRIDDIVLQRYIE